MQQFPPQLLAAIGRLPPACFAVVMATGIVGIAAHMEGLQAVGAAMFRLNLFAWVLLWMLTLARLACFPRVLLEDLVDHVRGPGFFTMVAGTSVLAAQWIVSGSGRDAAFVLGAVAAVLWFVLTYAIFTAFTIKQAKPPLERGIHGGWLLAVVGTQSLAVLAGLLAPEAPQPLKLQLNFFALAMWLWGGMFYIWMVSLIFYRYMFFPLSPDDLTPAYWINMGAMAISTLAGSLLVLNAPQAPLLESLAPFIKGFTVFYWATGTWWIPMLLLLGVWRYVVKRHPLRYSALYWGAVFPLGMYSAATHEMAVALKLGFLAPVAVVFLWAAFGAWSAAAIGLGRSLLRQLRRQPS
jgi:tellurite resistance protein TehA-like permease